MAADGWLQPGALPDVPRFAGGVPWDQQEPVGGLRFSIAALPVRVVLDGGGVPGAAGGGSAGIESGVAAG